MSHRTAVIACLQLGFACSLCVPGCTSNQYRSHSKGAIIIELTSLASLEESCVGWFTRNGKKVPNSDFDVPNGVYGLNFKGKLDEDGHPYILEIQFKDLFGKPMGDPIRPAKGTKPNDLHTCIHRR